MFARIEDGNVVETFATLPALKAAFPAVVFLSPLTPEDLAPHDILMIEDGPEPQLAPGERTLAGEPALVDGACIRPRIVVPVTPERLIEHEQALHRAVDQAAGAFRLNFITDAPGQPQTYAEKEREALAYAADPAGIYPFLAAEADATGRTIAQVATEVAGTAQAWRMLGAAIEGTRIGAKRAVTAARLAGDWSAMDAAASVDWEALLA